MMCEACQLNLGGSEPIWASEASGHLFHGGCVEMKIGREIYWTCSSCDKAVERTSIRVIYLDVPEKSEDVSRDQRIKINALTQQLLNSKLRLDEEKRRAKQFEQDIYLWDAFIRTTKHRLDEAKATCAELGGQLGELSLG